MSTIQLSNITINRGKPPTDLLSRVLAFLAPEPGNMKPFSIEGLNLTIPHGKTLVILGPSGCGKSTLLRVISGLEEPDAGRVSYDGWDAKGISPGQRRIGMVFQNYALYPNLDNKENITSYFFFRKKTPEFVRMREEKFRRTSQLLDVEIEHLLHRMPSNLSGGEQQRVALGRCITRDPALFLMDEPFSNLDAKLRTKYRLHLKRLLKEFNITTVYVTHDQQEAVLLGDLVSIMRIETQEQKIIGRVEQTGTVRELYDQPVNAYVADFFNLHGDIQPISFVDGEVFDRALAACQIGVRPEDLRLGKKEKRPALRA
ncbi:MAG: ABC transporter ATP-binding protein, partial [SAR324 cluster bacterium]|nr:ABC transporter ATP-binding protein [SAR324 cluster bacterium]